MEREECFDLLKSWCDGLISYQIHNKGDSRFDGGFFCPACKMIHGRSQDAVYPLMCGGFYRRREVSEGSRSCF